jgi:capsid protein
MKRPFSAAYQDSLQPMVPSSRWGEDSLLGTDYYSIIDNALDLARNSGITRSIIQVFEDYVAGNGLTPSMASPEGLKVWHNWTSAPVNLAGTKSFSQVFRDIVSNIAASGDVLLTTPIDKKAGLDKIALRLELTSGARVRTPTEYLRKKDNFGRTVKFGVAFVDGVEVGYYVQRLSDTTIPMNDRTRAKNFDYIEKIDSRTGRLNAFLIRRPTGMAAEQTRGLPVITQSVQDIKDLDDLMLSAIQGSRNKALLSVILTSTDASGVYSGMGAVDSTGALIERSDDRAEAQIIGSLPDGAIMTAPEGTQASVINSSGEIDRDALMMRALRSIAAGVGVPYEILFKDYSQTNYSSGKLAMDSFFRLTEFWTLELSQVFQSIYKMIQLEASLKGFGIKNPTAENTNVVFIGSQNWVDAEPVKLAQAAEKNIKNNLTTATREAARRGVQYTDILIQKAEEYNAAKAVSEMYKVPMEIVSSSNELDSTLQGAEIESSSNDNSNI